ncbi:MAG: hypothetical protein VX619_04490 [bacterium]|nr:hypothetical protein [bacterium]
MMNKALFKIIFGVFIVSLLYIQSNSANEESQSEEDKIVTLESKEIGIIPLDEPGIVSLGLQEADVATVMKGISQLGNYDFVTKGEIDKRVNLTLKNRSIREALDIISDSTATEYRIQDTIITVFGDGVDPSFTKTYNVLKGNTQTIGTVLQGIIGGNVSTQGIGGQQTDAAQGGDGGGGGGGAAGGRPQIEKGSARIVVDKLNSQIIITAVPSDHRTIDKVFPELDQDRPKKRFLTRMYELKFITPDVFVRSIKFLIPGIEDEQIFQVAGGGAAGGGDAGGAGGGGGALSSSQKRVIIQDTLPNLNRISELLTDLDVPPRQVVIDVKMVEFTLNDDQKLGVDWKSMFTQSGRNLPVAEFFSPLASQGTGRLKFGSLGPDHLQVVLDFIKANSTAKILSNPQLTVVDGQQASITVGDQIPYRTTVIQNGTAVGQVNFANAGVELSVTPVIFKDDFVNLIIQPSITSRTGDFDGIPIISTKVTNTTLNIRNNHTVIMGGLISHSDSIEQNQIPIVGQIPGIGHLFRNNSRTHRANELVFFITPKIYSEFATHPHDSLNYEFREPEFPKPTAYKFTDREQQQKELREFRKRNRL